MIPGSATDADPEGTSGEELRAVFHTVEQTDIRGQRKFTPATCRHLTNIVASRAYAKRLTELCHLVVAAAAYDQRRRYEPFFWACGPARSSIFRSYFKTIAPTTLSGISRIAIGPDAITLGYDDGDHTIAFSRMPVLSALAEFLLTALGYVSVNTALEPLLAAGVDRRTVELSANALARQVHRYLSDRLDSAQNLRKFHVMAAFLRQRDVDGPKPESIDDATVLEFWLRRSADVGADDLGFRTYRSVFKSFLKFHVVLTEARQRYELSHPRSLGREPEKGEINPNRIFESLEIIGEPRDLFATLTAPPVSRIKYFNQRELHDVEDLVSPDRLKERLALSVLRNRVFGGAQSRLSNAVRGGPGADATRELISNAVQNDYQTEIDRFRKLLDHTERVLLASLYVLIRKRKVEAFSLIATLAPAMDLALLKEPLMANSENGENVVSLPGATPAERFVCALDAHPERLGADIARLVEDACLAYRSINRVGFRDGEFEDDWVGDGFAAAAGTLIGVRAVIDRAIGALDNAAEDWRCRFDKDQLVFTEQFQLIYGECHDQAAE